jgi:hypothetical protein
MKFFAVVAAMSFALSAQSAMCAEVSHACPQFIPAAVVQLSAPSPEWKPFVSAPLYLNGAAPADGPPERLGRLREDASAQTNTGWTRKYLLNRYYPEGKWFRCDYGTLGEASLAKRLPDTIQECTVTGNKASDAGETRIQARCR